jgi:DNA-binding response OmpR family regulator
MPSAKTPLVLRLAFVGPTKLPRSLATLDAALKPRISLDHRAVAAIPAVIDNGIGADVIIVDGRLDRCLDAIRDLRTAAPRVPIFFIADTLTDVTSALSAGANDFVLDGAGAHELVLRLEFLASGAARGIPILRRIGALRLDHESRELHHKESRVSLSPIELKLFERLLVSPSRPVSRADLERSVWGPPQIGDRQTNIAVVYVSYLRRKLAKLGGACVIRTLPNVGYAIDVAGLAAPSPSTTTDASKRSSANRTKARIARSRPA